MTSHRLPPQPAQRLARRRRGGQGLWGGIVAPRDFDPFAWMPNRPWAGDWLWGMGTEPGQRILNGGQHNRYAEPIRSGDIISVTRRFIDVIERDTKRGPMVFFTRKFRWQNQAGALVRLGEQTSIYYRGRRLFAALALLGQEGDADKTPPWSANRGP